MKKYLLPLLVMLFVLVGASNAFADSRRVMVTPKSKTYLQYTSTPVYSLVKISGKVQRYDSTKKIWKDCISTPVAVLINGKFAKYIYTDWLGEFQYGSLICYNKKFTFEAFPGTSHECRGTSNAYTVAVAHLNISQVGTVATLNPAVGSFPGDSVSYGDKVMLDGKLQLPGGFHALLSGITGMRTMVIKKMRADGSWYTYKQSGDSKAIRHTVSSHDFTATKCYSWTPSKGYYKFYYIYTGNHSIRQIASCGTSAGYFYVK